MAKAGSHTFASDDAVDIYDEPDEPCSTIYVGNDAGSSGDLLVNVPGLHDAGEFLAIAPGEGSPFHLTTKDLKKVTAKREAGTSVTAHFGVIAR